MRASRLVFALSGARLPGGRLRARSTRSARTLERELATDLPSIAVYRQDAELELRASWTNLDCAE